MELHVIRHKMEPRAHEILEALVFAHEAIAQDTLILPKLERHSVHKLEQLGALKLEHLLVHSSLNTCFVHSSWSTLVHSSQSTFSAFKLKHIFRAFKLKKV